VVWWYLGKELVEQCWLWGKQLEKKTVSVVDLDRMVLCTTGVVLFFRFHLEME
jgi:hypothetical protein